MAEPLYPQGQSRRPSVPSGAQRPIAVVPCRLRDRGAGRPVGRKAFPGRRRGRASPRLWGAALAGVLLAIVAAFKTYSERPKPNIVLLPVEDQSGWAQAVQQDGSVITQFSVHFQATNVSDGTIKLSEITLRRPWVRRRSILTRLLLLNDPNSKYYGSAHPVPAHTLSFGSATIIVDHARGKKASQSASSSLCATMRGVGTSWSFRSCATSGRRKFRRERGLSDTARGSGSERLSRAR